MGDFDENKNKPIEFKIEGNSSLIKEIICGSCYTFAICENKKIYCWGNNYDGQLGLGDYDYRNEPVEFFQGSSSSIKQIICCGNYTNHLLWKSYKSFVVEIIHLQFLKTTKFIVGEEMILDS